MMDTNNICINMPTGIFSLMSPCSLVSSYQSLGRFYLTRIQGVNPYIKNGGKRIFWNASIHFQDVKTMQAAVWILKDVKT